jgi:Uma2 family endonuclease
MVIRHAQRAALLTLDEYLDIEMQSSQRHEYVGGAMHAFAGASEAQNRIALNVAAFLLQATGDGPCRVFIGDMKLQVSEDAISYPDVMVTCDPADNDQYIKRSPILVVEVLSPSTVSIDRRENVLAYRGLKELSSYVILHQDAERAIVHERDEHGTWWEISVPAGGSIRIAGLDIDLPMDIVYKGIQLSSDSS